MRKHFFGLLSVVMIASMLLAACAPAGAGSRRRDD